MTSSTRNDLDRDIARAWLRAMRHDIWPAPFKYQQAVADLRQAATHPLDLARTGAALAREAVEQFERCYSGLDEPALLALVLQGRGPANQLSPLLLAEMLESLVAPEQRPLPLLLLELDKQLRPVVPAVAAALTVGLVRLQVQREGGCPRALEALVSWVEGVG